MIGKKKLCLLIMDDLGVCVKINLENEFLKKGVVVYVGKLFSSLVIYVVFGS